MFLSKRCFILLTLLSLNIQSEAVLVICSLKLRWQSIYTPRTFGTVTGLIWVPSIVALSKGVGIDGLLWRTCLCIVCLFGKFVMQGYCMMTFLKFKKDVRVLISSVLKVDYFLFWTCIGGREATTGNASAVRRLASDNLSEKLLSLSTTIHNTRTQLSQYRLPIPRTNYRKRMLIYNAVKLRNNVSDNFF